MPWRWYVYDIRAADGSLLYVGKGSGYRLTAQRRNHKADGVEVARFKREKDAYAFEIERIAELRPPRNIRAGGDGPQGKPPALAKYTRMVNEIGQRRYSARLLLSYAIAWPPSELEKIRSVAYGPRC